MLRVLRRLKLPVLLSGALALAFGLGSGLARLGVAVPAPFRERMALHGALMALGFFGTFIHLERAVAFGTSLAWLAPLLSMCGVVVLVGLPGLWQVAAALFALSSLALLPGLTAVLRRQPSLAHALMLAGNACLLTGVGAWLVSSITLAVSLWSAFLILTITSERLELSALRRPPRAASWLLGALCASLIAGAFGLPLASGLAMAGIGLWLARYDIAGRLARRGQGLPRFIALNVLLGSGWLVVSGALALAAPAARDAQLHSLFLGFVLSMVFAHAPVILPAVLKIQLPFKKRFYAHCGLLQLSVVLRVLGGTTGNESLRAWSGGLTLAAILMFAASSALACFMLNRSSERIQRPSGRIRVTE